MYHPQDAKLEAMEVRLREISKNTQAIAATNIAKILTSSKSSSSPSSATDTPNSSFRSDNEDVSVPTITIDEGPESPKSTPQPQVKKDAQPKPLSYTKGLLPSSQLTSIFLKSKTRRNFAALLVKRLFDVETRLKSNVSGRGKEQLDPEIIKYVKAKAFEFYECPQSDIKEEWAKCVVSIDEKSRALKKLKSFKENQSIDVIDDKLDGLSKLRALEERNGSCSSRDAIDERIQALMKLKKENEKQ